MAYALRHLSDHKAVANRIERCYLTIMFCDLVNFTRLTTRMDPEDLLRLVQAYRRLCAEVINNHNGFLASFMGDGVMSFYGYPRPQADDARRAVRSALDLINAVKARKTRPGAGNWDRLSVRTGIASGPVVLGRASETGFGRNETVIGETPNLAARLQALAQPDTVIVSDETRNLIQGSFRLEDVGLHSLRGWDNKHRLWQVIHADRRVFNNPIRRS